MNSLSETQLVVGQQHDFQLQIAQKILKLKIKACPSNAGL